ncbi:MAG: hypothetical protein AAF399_08390 [Bacteroidota bacterium]
MKRTLFSLLIILFSTLGVSAQGTVNVMSVDPPTNFFITILAGIVLAFAFQLLLTMLSVALGITAIGDLKKAYAEHKFDSDDDDDDSSSNVGIMISSGLGVYNVITTSISLFAACMLAFMLTPIDYTPTNIALALVIWAVFYMLMFYIESRMIGSLIGGLFTAVLSGLKASGTAIQRMFTPSTQTQVQRITDATIEKLKAEFGGSFDADGFVKRVEKQLTNVSSNFPTYDTLKSDIRRIVAESKSQGSQGNDNSVVKWTAIQTALQTAIESNKTNGASAKGKEKANQLQSLLQDVKEAYEEADTNREAAKKVATQVGIDPERVDQVIDRFESFLSGNNFSDTNTDWKQQLQEIIEDPQAAVAQVKSKLKQYDKEKIVSLLAKNTSLDRDQAAKYAEDAEAFIQQFSADSNSTTSPYGDQQNSNEVDQILANIENFFTDNDFSASNGQWKQQLAAVLDDPKAAFAQVKEQVQTLDRDKIITLLANNTSLERERLNAYAIQAEQLIQEYQTKVSDNLKTEERLRQLEKNVAQFIDGTDVPELDYQLLKADFEQAMAHPKDSLSIVKNRLDTFDTNTLVSLIDRTGLLTRDQLRSFQQSIDEAKTEVSQQISRLENSARGAVARYERKAVIQAEHTRKAALAAAWWLVLSIVLSGSAATLAAVIV